MSARRIVSLFLVATLLSIGFLGDLSHPAPVASSADPGTIAYVRGSTNEIRLIQPDGTNDRTLWTSPQQEGVVGIPKLEWRPDAAELAFSSEHEHACSWYDTDIYSILPNGTGLRRVTNSPDCVGLAGYPQGRVTVTVNSLTSSGWVSLYVQGARELKGTSVSPGSSSQVTFENVADLGPGVFQPAVAIFGLHRFLGEPPAPDVQAGQTTYATVWVEDGSRVRDFGTGKLSWRSDGSAIAYAMRDSSALYRIPANPPPGSYGQPLPTLVDYTTSLVDWAPTASKADQFLYNVPWDRFEEGVRGIYLTSTTQTGGGNQLVSTNGPGSALYQQFGYDPAAVWDLKWLPDGSGFLFIESYIYVPWEDPDAACNGTCADVFEYNLATGTVTQVTRLAAGGDDDTARELSISPDGQYVAIQRITEDPYDPFNASSAIWVVGRDGSGLRQLVDDGWSMAWGRTWTPPVLPFHVYLPLAIR